MGRLVGRSLVAALLGAAVGAVGACSPHTDDGPGPDVGRGDDADAREDGDPGAEGDDGAPPVDPCAAAAARNSFSGCEFWAVDLPNADVVTGGEIEESPDDKQFAVVVTNPSPGPVTVRVWRGDAAGETEVTSFGLASGELRVVPLGPGTIPAAGTSLVYSAYRVTSDGPVVAYQFNPLDNISLGFSADASLLLPAHAAATSYVAVTPKQAVGVVDRTNFYDWPAFVSVVAIAEGTTRVTVRPSSALAAGPGGGTSAPTFLDLQRYQVWTVASDGIRRDLTGTRVEADRPVVVFSGATAAIVPNISADENRCCADHVEEQVFPRTTWGRRYAGVASRVRMADGTPEPTWWVVVGGVDGTTLEWFPDRPSGAPESIGEDRTVLFRHDGDFLLLASQPVQVVQLLASSAWTTRLEGGRNIGDPSMINVPPVEQFVDTYAVPIPPGYMEDYLLAVVPQGTSLTLDGSPVAEARAVLGTIEGTTYERVTIRVEDGTRVLGGSQPFGLIVLGIDSSVSYGFPAGLGLEPIFLI